MKPELEICKGVFCDKCDICLYEVAWDLRLTIWHQQTCSGWFRQEKRLLLVNKK